MNESLNLDLPKVDSQVLENPNNNIFENNDAELEDMQTVRPLKYEENERNLSHDPELELFSQNKRVENKPSLSFFSRTEKKKGTWGKSKEIIQPELIIEEYLIVAVKKFIFKLKKALIYRSLNHISENMLKMINDKVYFHGPNNYSSKNILGFLQYIGSSFLRYLNVNLPLIYPFENFRVIWDIFHFSLIFFLFFFIPINVCFQTTMPTLIYFLITSFFVIDLVLNFNTGYFHKGYMVISRRRIAMHYLKNQFIFDLLTAFIFLIEYAVEEIYQTNFLSGLYKFIIYFRLPTFKLLYNRIIEKFRLSMRIHMSVIELFNLLYISLMILHLFASFWYFIALQHQDDPTYQTWLTATGVIHESTFIKYLYSLYWSTATIMTVGYGDISAHNSQEVSFIIFTVVVGCMVFAYIINSIGNIIGEINKQNIMFKNNMFVINKYMERKGISLNLQMKIREYLRFIWKEELTQNQKIEDKIINSLSKSLKEELFLEAHGSILNKHPMFFANFSDSTLRLLMYKMQEIRLTPEDEIFSDKEKDECEIYFISKGKVQLLIIDGNDEKRKEKNTILQELTEGNCFGEVSFFSGLPRVSSAQSKDYTTLFLIKRSDFLNILSQNSDDYEKYCMIRDQIILEKNFKSIGLKCFSCNQNTHITLDCPYIHYIPDKDRIIKVHTFSPEQKERFYFQRNPSRSLNARSDKIQIKIAQMRIKDEFKELHHTEEDLLYVDSFQSYEEPTEKEISEYEKFKSLQNIDESKQENDPTSLNLINNETGIKTITMIKDNLDENNNQNQKEEHKENNVENSEKSLSHIKNSPKIFRLATNLSIQTNSIKKKILNKDLQQNRNSNNKIKFKRGQSVSSEKTNKEENIDNETNIDTASKINIIKKRGYSNDSKISGSMFFPCDNFDVNGFNNMSCHNNNSRNHSFNEIIPFNLDGNFQEKRKRSEESLQKIQITSSHSNQMNLFDEDKKKPEPVLKKKFTSNMDEKINGNLTPLYPSKLKRKETYSYLNNPPTLVLDIPQRSESIKKVRLPEESDYLRSPMLKTSFFGDRMNDNREEIDNKKKENINEVKETLEYYSENIGAPFEIVKNFKNYYPQNNIKEIMIQMLKYRRKKFVQNRKDKKRRTTRKFTNYFNKEKKNERTLKNSHNSNKIFPAGAMEFSLDTNHLNSPKIQKIQDRRASNIFMERSVTMNFFKKPAIKYTFYDIVYEVLNNKDLRKQLHLLREKSQKNKLKTEMTSKVNL